jgi:protease-4
LLSLLFTTLYMENKPVPFKRIFWPSLLAMLIVSVISLIIFFVMLGGLVSGLDNFTPPSEDLQDKTILHMTLSGDIGEKSETSFDTGSLQLSRKLGLCDILYGIESAKKDERVKGIYLDLKDFSSGWSTTREIRKALQDFKKSGKFIVAYHQGEMISQRNYYLSSVASEVYAFPSSVMEFTGLGAELTFFKGTLDKLDIEVDIIRGNNNDFKSAVEPFFLTSMSDSSRTQISRYLMTMWEDIRKDMSLERNLPIEKLHDIADELLIRKAKDAVQFGLIDDVLYKDQVMDKLRKKINFSKDKDLTLHNFERYAKTKFLEEQMLIKDEKPSVAVVIAEGEVSTEGEGLSSKEICRLFQEIRKNRSIKSVVFRINSPGGSALASDEIWREVYLTSQQMKVVVSMGDVAASGGYYIAAPAVKIFAEPTTITGSIGVFGMVPYIGKMLENKLGITFDRVGTNRHSIVSLNRKLTPEELGIMQQEVDNIYSQFLDRVSEGRNMSKDRVHDLARGRVWTGIDAKRIGLVDELGGLNDAIQYARKLSGKGNGKVLFYPLVKEDKLGNFLEMLEADEEATSQFSSRNSDIPESLLTYYEQLKSIENRVGIQMRLPYDILFR